MKKILYSILVFGALQVSAKADLMYYTFEGNVTFSTVSEIVVGTKTTYVFGVDFDAQGLYDYLNPSRPDSLFTDYKEDINNLGRTVDYVYVDVVGQTLLSDENDRDVYEYNFGASIDFFDNSKLPDRNFLFGGQQYSNVQVYTPLYSLDKWEIGTNVIGFEQSLNASTNRLNRLYSNLTLTSISSNYSVPEPSVIFLMIAGILGLSGYHLFNRKNG
jgi:hypothetical protein